MPKVAFKSVVSESGTELGDEMQGWEFGDVGLGDARLQCGGEIGDTGVVIRDVNKVYQCSKK